MAKGKNLSPKQYLTKMLAELNLNDAYFDKQVTQLISGYIPCIPEAQFQQTLKSISDDLKSRGCKSAKLDAITAKFHDEMAREFRRLADRHASTSKTFNVPKPTLAPNAPKIQNSQVQQPEKQISGPLPATQSAFVTQEQAMLWPPTSNLSAAAGTQVSRSFSQPFPAQQHAGFNFAQQLPQSHNQSSFGSHRAGSQGTGSGTLPAIYNFRGPVPQTSSGSLEGHLVEPFSNTGSNQESASATKKAKPSNATKRARKAALELIRSIMTHVEMSLKAISDLQGGAIANANQGYERSYFLNSLEVAVIRAYIHHQGSISDRLKITLRPALATSLPNNVVERSTAKVFYHVELILQKWYMDGVPQIPVATS